MSTTVLGVERAPTGTNIDSVTAATKLAMRTLARRYLALLDEISHIDVQLTRLVRETAPQLLEQPGIGVQCAAQLLVTAGDNPQRLRSESSFAHLCGVAPLPASSGKTQRHRLNRGGDRDANCALHMIAVNRLSRCTRTRSYVNKRCPDGKADLDTPPPSQALHRPRDLRAAARHVRARQNSLRGRLTPT